MATDLRLADAHQAEVDRARQDSYIEAISDIRSAEDEPVTSTGIIQQGWKQAAGELRGPGDLQYDEILEVVWQIFLRHPVAKRLSEIKRDHILGRGMEIKAEADEELQEILDDFWARNQMHRFMRKLTHQLYLFGEQILLVAVRKTDGQVSLGYIDPSEVECVIQNPNNVLKKCAVVLKNQVQDENEPWKFLGKERRIYRIIRPYDPDLPEKNASDDETGKMLTYTQVEKEPWENILLEHYALKEYTGDVLYWSVNDVANQSRGLSDFHQLVPHLAYLEDVLMTLADRENLAALAAWDIEIEGATEQQCLRKSAKLARNPPQRGSFIVHNEKEKWKFALPGIGQAATLSVEEALLDMVCGGAGVPRSWFGEGGEEGRATAREQNRPTWATLQYHQDELRDEVLDLAHVVRDQAEIAGTWTEPEPQEIELSDDLEVDAEGNEVKGEEMEDLEATPIPGLITVEMSEVSSIDIQAISVALERLTVALQASVTAGWLTKRRSAIILAKTMREIGVEYDPEIEFKLAQVEQAAEQFEEAELPDDMAGDVPIDDPASGRSDRMEPDQEPEPEDLDGSGQIVDSSKESVEDHSSVHLDVVCPLCGNRGARQFEGHGPLAVCESCGSTFDLYQEVKGA